PGRAEAKLDLRLVPDMTREEAEAKLKAHLAKRGFSDIIVNVSGGYSPTETDENSILVTSQKAALKNAGVEYSINPRQAGSWPGVTASTPADATFTGSVTTSTAVSAMVPTTQPPSARGKSRISRRNTIASSQRSRGITIASLPRRALRLASGASRRPRRPEGA